MFFHHVCGQLSVCQYVTVCDCTSVCEWEVYGVEIALMELDVVHNRQDITSERGLKERDREEKRRGKKKYQHGRRAGCNIFMSHDIKNPSTENILWYIYTLVYTCCIKMTAVYPSEMS